MATSLGQSEFQAMLKELYPDGTPEHVAVRNRPFLKMVPKKDDFEGDLLVVPVQYEFPMGRSATFTTAQANAAPSKMVKFTLTQMSDYQTVLIDALTIRASRSKRGAFVEARKNEVDGMLRSLGRSASISLYGDGWGHIGEIAVGGINGATITLADHTQVKNFGVGQKVFFADEADGGVARASRAVLTVISRDAQAGTVTFNAAVSTIAGVVVGDFIFVDGDNDGDTIKKRITGLAGWLPLVAPGGGDAFFGVDRSVDAERLAGYRLNATDNSIEENILTVAEGLVANGSEASHCFINHTNFSNMVKSLGSKVEYDDDQAVANFGFRGVKVHTSAGTVTVYPDPDCPGNRGYVLQMNTWCLHHLDGMPHLDTIDGNSGLRMATADGLEIRARYWANLACRAPAYNGVFAI